MAQDASVKTSTALEIDLRKASKECKLPYLLTHALLSSRVGRETTVEFGSINQNELANAIVAKEPRIVLEATIHSRVMLSPHAVLMLYKQLGPIVEALQKENPDLELSKTVE